MNPLEYAIEMGYDGERYYREQAEINKNNSLYSVCLLLADEEKKHALVLTNKLNEKPYELKDSDTFWQAKNIFNDIGNIKVDGKETPDQLDFYKIALDMEKQSIDLYRDFLAKTTEKKEKELFAYLIKEEQQYYEFLEELVSLLRHGEEWVESAEFGTRKYPY